MNSHFYYQCLDYDKTDEKDLTMGAPGKCELYELFMSEYFNMIFLQTSILNHHTFLVSSSAVLPVTMVFPLHTVTDSPGTDITLAHVLDIFLLCNNLKPYKATNLQKSFLFHT